MSVHQLKTYHKTDWSPKAEQLRKVIADNPGRTIAQLAELIGWHKSSVSGRVNDLKKAGCITTTSQAGGDVYAYDPDPARWPSRAKHYEVFSDLKRIEKFVDRYGSKMTEAGKIELRALYKKVRKEYQ